MNTKIPGYSFFKDHMRHLRMSIFGCTVVANLIILLNTRGPGNEGLSDEGFHDDLVSVIRDEAHLLQVVLLFMVGTGYALIVSFFAKTRYQVIRKMVERDAKEEQERRAELKKAEQERRDDESKDSSAGRESMQAWDGDDDEDDDDEDDKGSIGSQIASARLQIASAVEGAPVKRKRACKVPSVRHAMKYAVRKWKEFSFRFMFVGAVWVLATGAMLLSTSHERDSRWALIWFGIILEVKPALESLT